jgi:peptide/nickel transport system permease protein
MSEISTTDQSGTRGRGARGFLNVYLKNRMGLLGLAIIFFFFMMALSANAVAPYPPNLMTNDLFAPPSAAHWMGTNDVGQDLYSQLLFGARVSLLVGLISAFINTASGTLVGVVAGYFGGKIDEFLMRITDILLIIPRIPIIIVLAAFLGPSIWNIILVLVALGWTNIGRVVRSQTLALREQAFVESAKAIGAGNTRILTTDIVPNLVGIIVPQGVLAIVGAILAEAGLSFLGLGDPTQNSWGLILYYAEQYGAFLRGAWWWIGPPGLSIALISIGFTFVGYALNDIFNPQLKRFAA